MAICVLCTLTLVCKTEGKKDNLKDVVVDEYNIKLYINEAGGEGVDSIYLAKENNKWRALTETVTNEKAHDPVRQNFTLYTFCKLQNLIEI